MHQQGAQSSSGWRLSNPRVAGVAADCRRGPDEHSLVLQICKTHQLW